MSEKTEYQINIRVDPELFRQAEEIAKSADRTVTQQVRYWIRKAMEEELQGVVSDD